MYCCLIATIDIKVINVIGDGNFFSWCISVYFNDTQTHHETIRQQVVNKMQSNSNTYKQFVSGSFRLYQQYMNWWF
jgi:ABC-type thiamine transport system substrate-binding protein